MADVAKQWVGGDSKGLHFWCPACSEVHQIVTDAGSWQWNGSLERPTISPSILVTSGHYAPGWTGPTCYCNTKPPDSGEWRWKCERCHSYVREGKIEYLDDCTHALKGKTIALPPWAEHQGAF